MRRTLGLTFRLVLFANRHVEETIILAGQYV